MLPPRRRRFTRSAAPSRCTSPASHRPRRCRSLTPAGQTLETQSANSLGGLLFRNVPPATGYRVRRDADGLKSGALTVHSDRGGALESGDLQPIDSRQRIHVPHHPRRDAARHQRAPADEPGGRARPPAGHEPSQWPRLRSAVPDADRVLGLRVRQPGRPGQRHRGPREPDGLRGRRREHARDRLLGWRLRFLRAAAEPRRVRRDRDDRASTVGAGSQGRDDGHLLRGDQPAVHGPAPPAEPRGHLPALGSRRHGDDALSGRHPQHRLCGCLGRAAPARGASRPDRTADSPGRTSRSRVATRRARPTRCCTARRPT